MEVADQAMAIIEAYCGQSFALRQVSERISLKHNIGRLTHMSVVAIEAVKVRANDWAFASVFGSTEWVDVDADDVLLRDNVLVVPGGIFDARYDEAEVTYTVGYRELPEAVAQARDLLVRHIPGDAPLYAASALITPEIAQLLAPFKQGGGER